MAKKYDPAVARANAAAAQAGAETAKAKADADLARANADRAKAEAEAKAAELKAQSDAAAVAKDQARKDKAQQDAEARQAALDASHNSAKNVAIGYADTLGAYGAGLGVGHKISHTLTKNGQASVDKRIAEFGKLAKKAEALTNATTTTTSKAGRKVTREAALLGSKRIDKAIAVVNEASVLGGVKAPFARVATRRSAKVPTNAAKDFHFKPHLGTKLGGIGIGAGLALAGLAQRIGLAQTETDANRDETTRQLITGESSLLLSSGVEVGLLQFINLSKGGTRAPSEQIAAIEALNGQIQRESIEAAAKGKAKSGKGITSFLDKPSEVLVPTKLETLDQGTRAIKLVESKAVGKAVAVEAEGAAVKGAEAGLAKFTRGGGKVLGLLGLGAAALAVVNGKASAAEVAKGALEALDPTNLTGTGGILSNLIEPNKGEESLSGLAKQQAVTRTMDVTPTDIVARQAAQGFMDEGQAGYSQAVTRSGGTDALYAAPQVAELEQRGKAQSMAANFARGVNSNQRVNPEVHQVSPAHAPQPGPLTPGNGFANGRGFANPVVQKAAQEARHNKRGV